MGLLLLANALGGLVAVHLRKTFLNWPLPAARSSFWAIGRQKEQTPQRQNAAWIWSMSGIIQAALRARARKTSEGGQGEGP